MLHAAHWQLYIAAPCPSVDRLLGMLSGSVQQLASSWTALLALLLVCTSANGQQLKLNHLQVLHAHNSYHACPLPNMVALIQGSIGEVVAQRLGPSLNPRLWLYSKPSLLQLVKEYGVRSLEIDMFYDAKGGTFQFRAGPKLAAVFAAINNTGQDGGSALATPGWKVMHVPDFDFQSTCATPTECLKPIAAWSKQNKKHTPLFITFEIKSWDPNSVMSASDLNLLNSLLASGAAPLNLSASSSPAASQLQALQAELLKIFPKNKIYTPDQFRHGSASLQDRITKTGWPALNDVMGKVIFRIQPSPTYTKLYRSLWPQGKGSIFFLEASYDGTDIKDTDVVFAATELSVLKSSNDTSVKNVDISIIAPATWQTPAVADAYRALVANLVSKGRVMLRATADTPLTVPQPNNNSIANALMAGGAHLIHTDYPNGWKQTCVFQSNYTVFLQQVLAGSYDAKSMTATTTRSVNNKASSRVLAGACNPITADKKCRSWSKPSQQPPASCKCYSQI